MNFKKQESEQLEVGSCYYYIRDNMLTHSFDVMSKTWAGEWNDLMRLAKGNVYMREDEANVTAAKMKEKLYKLKKYENYKAMVKKVKVHAIKE